MPPGEYLAEGDLTVNAESAVDRTGHPATVEFVGRVSDLTFFHQVIVKLPDDPGVIGDFLLTLRFLGSVSNTARVTIYPAVFNSSRSSRATRVNQATGHTSRRREARTDKPSSSPTRWH